ncbi:hypothetical protein G7L32_26890, partial [Klebsiella quasipneumoniae]|nr:hypothetical protein [Klebsiella quasipneumoniae]
AARSLTRRWNSLFIRKPLAASPRKTRRKPRRCSTSRHRASRRPVSDPALEFAFYPQAAGGLAAENPEKAAPLL